MKVAVFIETIQEAKVYVEYKLRFEKDIDHIDVYSLNPNINAYLVKNNVECINSSSITCDDYYEDMMGKLLDIDIYFEEITHNISHKNIDSNNYKFITNLFRYHFNLICAHLLWDVQFIYKCNYNKKYDVIYGFDYDDVVVRSPWIEDEQLYIGRILEKYCQINSIKYIRLFANTKKVEKVRNIHKIIRNIYGFLQMMRYRYFRDKKGNTKLILIPNTSRNINSICGELDKNKYTVITMGRDNSNTTELYAPLVRYSGIKNDPEYIDIKKYISKIYAHIDIAPLSLFTMYSIFFQDSILHKAKNDLLLYLNTMLEESISLKHFLKILKPDIVLAQLGLGIWGALGYWAEKMGIPAILISHGSHIVHTNKYSEYEQKYLANNILVSDYKYLAVQSPLARMAAQKYGKNNEIINIQPIVWGESIIKNKKLKDKIVIVHASTLKYRHHRRYIYETSDEYVLSIKEIINSIIGIENISLIIKTRVQDHELSIQSLSELLNPLPENVIIETKKNILEILSTANLLVSYSSTTIEEALVNEIPVLLYGGGGRYAHIPTDPYACNDNIQTPVIFINSKDKLRTYFEKLSSIGPEFNVPSHLFSKYKFDDGEMIKVVDLIDNLVR